MEGIDYRGYRHIIPTQAAWAYVNDIKYNYLQYFFDKKWEDTICKTYLLHLYCIVLSVPSKFNIFRFAKTHQINLSQFAKGEPETLLFLE